MTITSPTSRILLYVHFNDDFKVVLSFSKYGNHVLSVRSWDHIKEQYLDFYWSPCKMKGGRKVEWEFGIN